MLLEKELLLEEIKDKIDPSRGFILTNHCSMNANKMADFRNNLLKLGITTLSAESSTEPGGYSNAKIDEEGQFQISDIRKLEEIQIYLKNNGYDMIIKDWDRAFK